MTPGSRRSRVTVVDVATAAGVGVSTAARALSGNGYVSAATRDRVLAEAERLGWVRNRAATSLRTRRTTTLGLVVADIENPFFATLAKSVEAASVAAGYRVVLCNSDDAPPVEAQHLDALSEHGVDGIIAAPTARNRKLYERLHHAGIVVVQIDRRVSGLAADAVVVDDVLGGELAVRRLLEAGHERIAMVTGPPDVDTARARLEGYERALHAAGVHVDPALVVTRSFHRGAATGDVRALLTRDARPTAIVAANNTLAETVWAEVAEARLRVPRDISVVAFDDLPWMAMVQPSLTTVRQPVERMARMAVELLVGRLDRGDGDAPPRTVTFDPELLDRASVGRAARRRTA